MQRSMLILLDLRGGLFVEAKKISVATHIVNMSHLLHNDLSQYA